MRKLVFVIAVLTLTCLSVYGMKSVNGREVPEKEDVTSMGNSVMQVFDQIDTLLSELANILSSTEGSDGLDIGGTIAVDTITGLAVLAGNPTIDSIQGMDVIRGNPSADSLTVSVIANVTGKISVDSIIGLAVLAGNPVMDSVQGMDVIRGNPSADSLTVSVIANVTGKASVDSIIGLDILQGNPMIDSVQVGASNASITSIDTASNSDTIVIIIGGATLKIAKDA